VKVEQRSLHIVAQFPPYNIADTMPPPKSRNALDDSRSEASSTKEKFGNTALNTNNGKGKRMASAIGTTSSLRDTVNLGGAMTTSSSAVFGSGQDVNVGVSIIFGVL
jgi:hypothetical protein